ncbi:MAG: DUF805 domain-containing protein [Treponema sp.]|jgi:uncharacterized membrane protein YhaH (DUF805 family)|nr:DUF805 domain-containing protein [Treponema sp.]
MTFTDYLTRSLDLSGRSRRREFWLFVLVYFLVGMITNLLNRTLSENTNLLFSSMAADLLFLPLLFVTIRRMHDTGRSGWFALIPVYGFILLFFRGNQGINKYGPNPADTSYNAENSAKTIRHCFAGITGNLSSPLAYVCTAAGIAVIFIMSFSYVSAVKSGDMEMINKFVRSPVYRLCSANNITVMVSLLIGPVNGLLALLAYAVMPLTGPVLFKAPQLLSVAVSACVLYFYGTKSIDKTKNVFRTMLRLFIIGILLQAGFHVLFLVLDLSGIAKNPYYAASLTRFPALFITLLGFAVYPAGMIYFLAFWAYVKCRKKWLALDGNVIKKQGETASTVQQNLLKPDDDLKCPACASVDYKPLGTKGFFGRAVVNLFFGFIAGAIYSKSQQNNTGDRLIVYKCSKCGNKWEAFPVKAGEGGRLERPCEIYFTRMGNFVGMAMAQFVYLNGRKIGPVKNGETITFTTERKQNLIFVTDHTGGAFDSRRFDAPPGGHIEFRFSRKFV